MAKRPGHLIARRARTRRPRRHRAGAAVAGPRGVGAADGPAGEPAGSRPPARARAAAAGPCRHAGRAGGRRLLADRSMRCSPAISPRPHRVRRGARRSRASRRPTRACWCCVDPILGDAGRLYVAQETAEAIRDRLLPLADDRHAQPVRAALAHRRSAPRARGDRASGAPLGPPHGRGHLGAADARETSQRCW